MYEVIVKSCLENVQLLRKMDLRVGRDFSNEKGAVAKGRPTSLLLKFKDRDTAMMFKLRAK